MKKARGGEEITVRRRGYVWGSEVEGNGRSLSARLSFENCPDCPDASSVLAEYKCVCV
jgi:hypothetical protein